MVPLAGTLALLLGLGQAWIDWSTWIDLDVPIIYVLPLVLGAATGNRRLLWGLALFLLITTFAVYIAQSAPGSFSLHEPHFLNRVLAAATLVLTAGLLHAWTLARDALATQRRALAEQNRELERLRAVAEKASSRKTQLLASVAHDIRTPLAAINLTSGVILRLVDHPARAAEIPELIRRLQRNTLSLVDLVSTLMDISALDAGSITLQESEFPLNDFLEDSCGRLQALAQAKGLQLAPDLPGAALQLRTDRLKLSRVVNNLLGNAIKFTDMGSVTVSALLTPERALLIRVADTGPGMSFEHLDRIFEEYGQLGTPGRDSNKGWGLGLAISRRLVNIMGGTITVESQVNRGTTFVICLPPSCVVVAP